MYTAFLDSIKPSGYRTGIIFDKGPLAAEQNNYLTKIVKAYIVYDLDAWPRNPTNNFKFKSIKEKSKIVIKKSLSIVDTE